MSLHYLHTAWIFASITVRIDGFISLRVCRVAWAGVVKFAQDLEARCVSLLG